MKININGSIVEVSDDTLKTAIEDKQESIEVKDDNLVIRTKDAQEKFENNIKTESKNIGEEIGRKAMFESLGIEIEGTGAHKTIEKSVAAINEWKGKAVKEGVKDAGIEPNAKNKALQEDLDAVRLNLETAKKETEKERSNFLSFKKDIGIRKALATSLKDETLSMPVEDVVDLMMLRNKFDQDEHGNTHQVGSDGQPIKDSDRNVLKLESSTVSFLDSNPHFRSSASGGAGGGDSNNSSGSKITYAEHHKNMTSKGYQMGSDEYVAETAKLESEGLLTD